MLRSVAWRDKTRKVLKMWTNQVSKCENWVSSFEKPPFLCIHHSKEFREMIYFSSNITIAICTYSEGTDQQHLHVQFKANFSKVQFKFWGDKKGPMEGFILSWISIFLSSLSFELSKLFNIFLKVCILVWFHTRLCKLKRDWNNMILNFRRESFSKTGMFLWAFQKLPQNAQLKNREA